MRIEDLRAEIDDLDEALIQLLNRRARTAIAVGVLKRTAKLPLCDADRERDVLTKVCQANAGPLDDEAITKLFRRIIRESRRLEVQVGEQASSIDRPEQKAQVYRTRTDQESRGTFDHGKNRAEMKVKRTTVVGCGLIGASFALALRRCIPDICIAGWDSSPSALNRALERGVIDEFDEAFERGQVCGSDLIYLAMPVGGIRRFLQDHGAQVAPGAIVTDAGSTKSGVCEAALNYLPKGRLFVGGHPVTGSHLAGLEHARADLFERAPYALIKDHLSGNDEALATMAELVEMLGARVILTTAAEHDRAMALISHLPQLISCTLAATIEGQVDSDALKQMAGPGYRDMTRLAGSSWSIWSDIFAANAGQIVNALDEMLDWLLVVRDELRRGAGRPNPQLVKASAIFNRPL